VSLFTPRFTLRCAMRIMAHLDSIVRQERTRTDGHGRDELPPDGICVQPDLYRD
jgi:hypothetical protein